MSELITPFKLTVADETLADLRSRLAQTRWPDRETVSDWSQGAPLDQVKALCDYWARDYDWRRCEARLNAVGQFRTIIDGLGIHFRHVRSPNPDAVPLIMTHGWPGSVIEFLNAIGPLTDPAAHGGNASDAFHVVVPSLPGYGFSDKPTTTGWGVESIAAAWVALMKRPCSRPTPSSGPRSFQARRPTPVTPQRITLTRPRPRRRPASAGPGSNGCSISTWNTSPLTLASPRRPNTPKLGASGDEGPEKSPILDRRRTCLTPRRFRRTFPFEEKGPLKILYLEGIKSFHVLPK